MENHLLRNLTDLKYKIKWYFDRRYNNTIDRTENKTMNNPSKDSKSNTTIVNNYYSDPYPYRWWWWQPSQHQTVIINNNHDSPSNTNNNINKNKKEKEEDHTLQKVVLIGVGIAWSFFATYILAKDEYIGFWLTEANKNINLLMKQSGETRYFNSVCQVKHAFEDWSEKMTERSRPILGGKICCFGSGFGLGGALFFQDPVAIAIGIAGMTASGCYLLWKNMTQNTFSEQDLYNKLLQIIEKFENELKNNDIREVDDSATIPVAYTYLSPQTYPPNNCNNNFTNSTAGQSSFSSQPIADYNSYYDATTGQSSFSPHPTSGYNGYNDTTTGQSSFSSHPTSGYNSYYDATTSNF